MTAFNFCCCSSLCLPGRAMIKALALSLIWYLGPTLLLSQYSWDHLMEKNQQLHLPAFLLWEWHLPLPLLQGRSFQPCCNGLSVSWISLCNQTDVCPIAWDSMPKQACNPVELVHRLKVYLACTSETQKLLMLCWVLAHAYQDTVYHLLQNHKTTSQSSGTQIIKISFFLYLNPWVFLILLFCFSPLCHWGERWASDCVGLSSWPGLTHRSPFWHPVWGSRGSR